MRATNSLKELDELRQVPVGHVAQLPTMTFLDGIGQVPQQILTDLGNPDFHHAPILGPTFTVDEPAFFEPIEHPRHIRRPGNQPGSQSQRRNRSRMSSLEQPQGVVLLCRKIVLREQLVFERLQAIIRPPQTQVRFLKA